MAQTRHREEIINVKLADELAARGLEADAESIQAKGRPDVLVDLKGIKLVVEGRHQKERASLNNDARTRVRKGIGDISLAVEYDDKLYTTNSTKLNLLLQASVSTHLTSRDAQSMSFAVSSTPIGDRSSARP